MAEAADRGKEDREDRVRDRDKETRVRDRDKDSKVQDQGKEIKEQPRERIPAVLTATRMAQITVETNPETGPATRAITRADKANRTVLRIHRSSDGRQ